MSSDESEEPAAIVIDGGSGWHKAGFAGDDAPSIIFPSILGTQKQSCVPHSCTEKSTAKVFVGDEVNDQLDFLTLRHPIEHGIVTNWDDMESIWAHCFKSLRVDPEEKCVVLSNPPLNPRANDERTLELMFEAFHTPACYLANSGQLILYSAGRHSGIVLDIGDGFTNTTAFYESFMFSDATQRQDFGGRDLTFYLQRLLYEKGHNFVTTSELLLVNEMKERLGFVSSDGTATAKSSNTSLQKSFTLPDGSTISIDKERYLCPEALFNPSLAGFPSLKGLPDLIHDTLSVCDFDTRPNILVNLLIAGGCALFPGLRDRLKFELGKLFPQPIRRNVVPVTPEKYATWIGGSILGSLSTFQHWYISKQEYEEYGPTIMSRRNSLW